MIRIMSIVSRCMMLFTFTLFEAQAQDKKLWVYFDLGDTVVSSKDMKKIAYIKGAKAYIEKLHREGYKVGMISNIPETWGLDYNEKLLSLKKVILDGWVDSDPFDWSQFDEILLPLKNYEMKPAPHLFLQAIEKAQHCPSIYIGESNGEILAAQSHGMAAKLFDQTQAQLYVPISELREYIIGNYKINYDLDCLN